MPSWPFLPLRPAHALLSPWNSFPLFLSKVYTSFKAKLKCHRSVEAACAGAPGGQMFSTLFSSCAFHNSLLSLQTRHCNSFLTLHFTVQEFLSWAGAMLIILFPGHKIRPGAYQIFNYLLNKYKLSWHPNHYSEKRINRVLKDPL